VLELAGVGEWTAFDDVHLGIEEGEGPTRTENERYAKLATALCFPSSARGAEERGAVRARVTRPRIVIMGAGAAGLAMGMRLRRRCGAAR
jgi:NADPH-dependent 2,4-dienoyl-CoA reductase/sulfur reductase-like enzyme